MSLLRCLRCTALFAVGLHSCPQCGAEKAVLHTGEEMAKTTTSGASNAAEEGESSSVGTNSSQSSESRPQSESSNEADSPKPAQTTEPHSKKDQTEDSSASSTGGDRPKTRVVRSNGKKKKHR